MMLKRIDELVQVMQYRLHRRTDHIFAALFIFEWLTAVALAIWVTPYTWTGAEHQIHSHVWIALILGLVIISLPMTMIFFAPGHSITRHVIAVAQLMISALYIHLTNGRIETHFHVFGSLTFLSIYRDWRILLTGSVTTLLDHIIRGSIWPESTYGSVQEQFRWIEHGCWVLFTDLFLFYACYLGRKDFIHTAEREASLEEAHSSVEQQVACRTQELAKEVTERTRSEEQLLKATKTLETAIREAEQASHAKSEFLANMSHEIRTPMNGILGLTEIVLETELTADQRESLKMVKSSANALLIIINEILDFSKIEAGKMKFVSRPFQLSELISEVLKSMALRVHQKGLEFVCKITPNLPDRIVGDSGRLRQILINLIGNAIKFTEQGEIILNIECSQSNRSQPTYRFTVSDTGIGIPSNKLSSIFDPFSQADGTTTRKYGGTGLGLSISARIIEQMGGRIWVESSPGEGSRFIFEVDFKKGNDSTVSHIETVVNLTGQQVYIVDDHTATRQFLSETLSLWGATTSCFESGQAVLTAINEHDSYEAPCNLILIDAAMHEMDGFQLVEQLRLDPKMEQTSIVMMTSSHQSESLGRCRDMRIESVLQKPFIEIDLKNAISNTLPSISQTVRRGRSQPAVAQDNSQNKNVKILLAEDNLINQRVFVKMLEKYGYVVDVVNDGSEAVTAVKRKLYDFVFMDVQMPIMDGYEATRQIRKHDVEHGIRTRIIAITAHSMKGDRERCLSAGMDDYLSKPIQQTKLLSMLQSSPSTLTLEDILTDTPLNMPAVNLPFNRSEAVERLGGDESLFDEMANLFLEDAPRLMTEIQHAIELGDAATVRRSAHGLKGTAGYVGGKIVADVAGHLEKIGELCKLDEAPIVYATLTKELNRLTEAVNQSMHNTQTA